MEKFGENINILGITGHRPQSFGFSNISLHNKIKYAIVSYLEKAKPDLLVTGMALGVDTWAAEAAIDLGIPFEAAVPFIGQEGRWSTEDQRRYKTLLEAAIKVTVVSPGSYSAEKMHIRNAYIVNKCTTLLAIYNGSKTGGTYNAVEFAKTTGKQIEIINPWELK